MCSIALLAREMFTCVFIGHAFALAETANDRLAWFFDKLFLGITYTISLCYLLFLVAFRRSKNTQMIHGKKFIVRMRKSQRQMRHPTRNTTEHKFFFFFYPLPPSCTSLNQRLICLFLSHSSRSIHSPRCNNNNNNQQPNEQTR